MEFKENICPVCNSDDIKLYGEIEIVDTQAYYPCECVRCGTKYKEWYSLNFETITDIEK